MHIAHIASTTKHREAPAIERRAAVVTGVVQGVGFRPFVHALATRHALGGFVRNAVGAVELEVEGSRAALDAFFRDLACSPPPLARIEAVRSQARAPRGDTSFRIAPSEDGEAPGPIVVAADVATCVACVREMLDPRDRRFRYPFLNCTCCGPRLSIVIGAPYDRARTTMRDFPMCEACRAEYEDPADRRFHAQPTACPTCGPRLVMRDAHGAIAAGDPIDAAARALLQGRMVAIKGIGGYHLACLARDGGAVRALRRRKERDDKPFAVMVADLAAARRLARVDDAAAALLESPARPIVLVPHDRARRLAAEVTGAEHALLGLLLPYAPLHHLLLAAVDKEPLVMTSGNRSDEPIAYDDHDASARLGEVADVFLTHDRAIETRCDDSVVRAADAGAPAVIVRRARGFAPEPVALPRPLAVPTLAVGGQVKATFALGEGTRAFVSHHLGDLDHAEALRAYEEAIDHYERLFRVAPARVVHDMHPDYASTRLAVERGLPCIAVQHHRAHVASAAFDAGVGSAVIGVAFDGAGYGDDGAIWGGEFFVGDIAQLRRVAHLAYVPLPGGARAMREPWRMAVAHAIEAGLDPRALPFASRAPREAFAGVARMCERRIHAPPTSSVGRLFDAVASLCGLADACSFEGQAAMALESAASLANEDGAPFDFDVVERAGVLAVDARPLVRDVVRALARGIATSHVARRFHETLAIVIATVCERLRARGAPNAIVLSGGVFVNAHLTGAAVARLRARGFAVHTHVRLPPNDGGLSYGQLAIAAALDAREGA